MTVLRSHLRFELGLLTPFVRARKADSVKERNRLSLVGTHESGEGQAATPGLDRYPALADAGLVLGMSGPALRKKFDRGDLPRKFLLRVGPRTLRVDIVGLLKFLKGEASQLSA